MGAKSSVMRRIIWCDTEGGVRGVPLWDVSFIMDDGPTCRAVRLCSPHDAHKKGRAALARSLPRDVFCDSCAGKRTCVTHYDCRSLAAGEWRVRLHAVVDADIATLTKVFLRTLRPKDDLVVAWNMNAHDRHVLARAAGDDALAQLRLCDALPWFRSCYGLPKNTLSSCRPGTPRAVFRVHADGPVHTSFVDALHLRDVVRRAAYCRRHDKDTASCAWEHATPLQLSQAALAEMTSAH